MKPKINLDALGMATSFACAIHCALLPLFLTSLPVFGINIIHNKIFEVVMIALALCIGSISLIHGYRSHHHRHLPVVVFFTGFIFLAAKQFFLQDELWFLIPAVIFIMSGHFLNYYFCRQSDHCHTDDCNH
jgi:hypothetical protein